MSEPPENTENDCTTTNNLGQPDSGPDSVHLNTVDKADIGDCHSAPQPGSSRENHTFSADGSGSGVFDVDVSDAGSGGTAEAQRSLFSSAESGTVKRGLGSDGGSVPPRPSSGVNRIDPDAPAPGSSQPSESPSPAEDSNAGPFGSSHGDGGEHLDASGIAPAAADAASSGLAGGSDARSAADDALLLEYEQQVLAGGAPLTVPPELVDTYRRLPLTPFYFDAQFGCDRERAADLDAGLIKPKTRQKDKPARSCWERFCPRPEGWPADKPWQGLGVGIVTDAYVTEFLRNALRRHRRKTMVGYWNHLRWMFNVAVSRGLRDRAPKVSWPKATEVEYAAVWQRDDESILETISVIWRSLRADPNLQDAFLMSCNVGMRPVDLFLTRWNQLTLDGNRPAVEFVARKTGKQQTVPLAPCVVAMLKRRRGELLFETDGLVFPTLVNAEAKDTEHTAPAKRRTLKCKAVLSLLGFKCDEGEGFEKPWQVSRATTNERLEAHRPGSGVFVLGHDLTLNSTSYRKPSAMIFDAVATLPQPDCWRVEG